MFGSDGINKLWIKPNEKLKFKLLIPTFKFSGGRIMIWECFSSKGVGNLVII